MSSIEKNDPAVWAAIKDEVDRQRYGLEMIASENYTSAAVMEATGSVLTNKYAEGYPGRRYYGGCEHVVAHQDQLGRMLGAQLCGLEARVVDPLGAADRVAEVLPLPISRHAEVDPAIVGATESGDERARRLDAHSRRRHLAGGEPDRQVGGERPHRDLHQGDLDDLALAREVSFAEREENR